jgi:hypothetical protein
MGLAAAPDLHPHQRRSMAAAAAAAAVGGRSSSSGGNDDDDDDSGPQRRTSAAAPPQENTHMVGPRAHAEAAGSPAAAQLLGVAPFDAAAACRALRAALHERVAAANAAAGASSPSSSGAIYDPLAAALMARRLAEDARQRLRALGYGRYKLVVQAAVGERKGQAVRVASRCLWGEGDGWASESYESDAIYCVVQVHAMYYE